MQFFFTNIITSASAPLVGYIYDHTHSYRIAFILMIVTPLISTIIWLVLPKYRYSANIGQSFVNKPEK